MRALAFASLVVAGAACQCARLDQSARFACETDADCPGSFCASDKFCNDPGISGTDGGGGSGGSGGSGGGLARSLPGCANGWCWDNPRPFGRVRLWNIHARAPDDVWASGELGTLFHFDGQSWSQQLTPINKTINGVWQSTTGDVWAVSSGGSILHLEQGRFVKDSSGAAASFTGDFFDIEGPPAGPPVAVGSQGKIMRHSPAGWVDASGITSGTFNAVAATSPGCEFAVGTTCRGASGSTFSSCVLPVPTTYYSVFQTNTGETWVGGSAGVLYRSSTPLDGGWEQMDAGLAFTSAPRGLWGDNAGEMYVGGSSGWAVLSGSTPTLTNAIQNIHGSSPDDVWAVSMGPLIFRRQNRGAFADGKYVTGLTAMESMTRVAVSTSGHAMITADRHAVYLRELDGGWSKLSPPSALNYAWYRGAWLDEQMRGWVVGDDPIRLAQYDHATRSVIPVSVGIAQDQRQIWGSKFDDVWTVGDLGSIYRLENGNWTQVVVAGVTTDLETVWGTSATDLYVGGDAVIAHNVAGTWTVEAVTPGATTYNDIDGLSATEVFAASSNGVYRRDPNSGTWVVDGLAGANVRDLAVASGKIMALTDSNAIYLRVNGAWAEQAVPWTPNGGISEAISCLGGADGVGFYAGSSVASAIFRWGI